MAGKSGEAALQEKLEQIRLDYLALVDKAKHFNIESKSESHCLGSDIVLACF